MEKPTSFNVFVYGTLCSGRYNNRVMTREGGTAELIGPAHTSEKFLLFNGGFPRLARVPWHGRRPLRHIAVLDRLKGHVVGEVWKIDEQALKNCDRLEGHPTFYRREPLPVVFEAPAKGYTTAWTYVIVDWPGSRGLMIPRGDRLKWRDE